MKKATTLARYLLGLIFLVMGINGFIEFLPFAEKGPEANAFFAALEQTGFFWPFEKTCEILFGVLLLTNRFVPLAVEGLAPIIANIMLFHLFLDLPGMPLALVVLACEAILVAGYWKSHFVLHFRSI